MRQPQAIAKAEAVTGNAARLVQSAHAVPMQSAGERRDLAARMLLVRSGHEPIAMSDACC